MLRAIAAVLKSVFASIGRWCAATKSWVYDRVVTPGVEYFHEAVAGASAAVTGLVPDVIKGAAKLPGQALRGTGALLEGGGKLAGGALAVAGALPQALASGLAGGRGAMPAPAPQQQSGAADEIVDALQALRAGRSAEEALMDKRKVRAAAEEYSSISAEADIVHRYAGADTYERDAVDLDELPPHLQDWLESLTERHLRHLSMSRVLCEAAVSGRSVGGGLPRPERPTSSGADGYRSVGTVGQVLTDPYAFGARVAAAKGVRRDRQPH